LNVYAWIFIEEDSEKRFTLFQSFDAFSPRVKNFECQSVRAVVHLISIPSILSLEPNRRSCVQAISKSLQIEGASLFVVFTHVDEFLPSYAPEKCKDFPGITSTSAEGTLSQMEDYFRERIPLPKQDKVMFLTVNCRDLQQMSLVQKFICSQILSLDQSSGETEPNPTSQASIPSWQAVAAASNPNLFDGLSVRVSLGSKPQ
jgi:hypothetical protein